MKQPKMGTVSEYRNCFILPIKGGFDVMDRKTGRWARFHTQRSAKWNATVWTRLSTQFEQQSGHEMGDAYAGSQHQ